MRIQTSKQKIASHRNWCLSMVKGFQSSITHFFWVMDAAYISQRTLVRWNHIRKELDSLMEDVKEDYEEYKKKY